ncbi:hypothetical protein NC651_015843 [Populus alba x Populus x berolinensis]|nr:hypothetical protein NC651_015843 [Populus alba x Populus x berolinensis]
MRMPIYFTCKVKNNRRVKVKYFNNIDDDAVSNKVIIKFDLDDLDLFYDDVVVNKNFDDDSLGHETN